MQENSLQQDNPVPTAPVVPPQVNNEVPKQNNFLVILLSVLLLLSVSVAGFFAYQTQVLVKELTNLKSSPTSIAQASTEPTVEPVSMVSATPDPTASWKTYSNSKIGASIKYPQNWTVKEETNGMSVDFDTLVPSPKIVEGNKVNYYFNFQLEDPANFQVWSNNVSSKKLTPVKINDMAFERIIGSDMYYSLNYIYKSPDGKIYRFYLGPYTEAENSTVLDETVSQILSTFKIVN